MKSINRQNEPHMANMKEKYCEIFLGNDDENWLCFLLKKCYCLKVRVIF